MPVNAAVYVTDEQSVAVYSLGDKVTLREILDGVARAYAEIAPEKPFSSLLIFEAGVDLSDIDLAALRSILAEASAISGGGKFGLRRGAALVRASEDARIVMPLWNAICTTNPDADLAFELFYEFEDALERLDITPPLGMKISALQAAPSAGRASVA
jgi:hypothetical protein